MAGLFMDAAEVWYATVGVMGKAGVSSPKDVLVVVLDGIASGVPIFHSWMDSSLACLLCFLYRAKIHHKSTIYQHQPLVEWQRELPSNQQIEGSTPRLVL